MQLQFLNLSKPSQRHVDQFVNGRAVRVCLGGNIIEGYFSFSMARDPNDRDKTRSKIRDLRICNELAGRLRRAGFEVGKVGPAKPWGGAFRLTTGSLEVTAIFSAARRPNVVRCSMLTWTRSRPDGVVEVPVVEAEWTSAIEKIEQVITQDLKGGPLVWSHEDDSASEK